MDYDKLSLEIVKNSEILKSEDFELIEKMKGELKDVFLHSQVFRTRTEMEVSVLNDLKFPTPDAKYWQSVREQNVMFRELVMLSYEYRKNLVEIKKLERQLKKEKDDLERELLQIEIERKKFISINQQRIAKDRIRELKEWHEIKEGLLPEMKYSLKDVNEHQLISYTKKFIKQYLAMREKGSPAERANLIGQLDKALKVCKQKGLLEKVLPQNPHERKKFLEKRIHL